MNKAPLTREVLQDRASYEKMEYLLFDTATSDNEALFASTRTTTVVKLPPALMVRALLLAAAEYPATPQGSRHNQRVQLAAACGHERCGVRDYARNGWRFSNRFAVVPPLYGDVEGSPVVRLE